MTVGTENNLFPSSPGRNISPLSMAYLVALAEKTRKLSSLTVSIVVTRMKVLSLPLEIPNALRAAIISRAYGSVSIRFDVENPYLVSLSARSLRRASFLLITGGIHYCFGNKYSLTRVEQPSL